MRSSPVPLRCLGGAPAPSELLPDLKRVSHWPEPAIEKIWEALGPSLPEPLPQAVESQLDAFCNRYRLPSDELAHALKALRFVVRAAGRANMGTDDLRADFEALGTDPRMIASIASGFDRAKGILQREVFAEALSDHGKLMTGANVRVDVVAATGDGGRLQQPVILLTLHTAEGDRRERITLTATPATIREMTALLQKTLSALGVK